MFINNILPFSSIIYRDSCLIFLEVSFLKGIFLHILSKGGVSEGQDDADEDCLLEELP